MYGMGDQAGLRRMVSGCTGMLHDKLVPKGRRLSATGQPKDTSLPVKTDHCQRPVFYVDLRWMKPISTISATSACKPGANRYSGEMAEKI